MKVLQINIFGNLSTGRIAVDLYRTLNCEGHEGVIAYSRNTIADDVQSFKFGTKLSVYCDVALTRLIGKAGFYSRNVTKKLIEFIEEYDPDIVHLHNIHGYYINIDMLFNYLKNTKRKVVWTLHDCWSFTGHCCNFEATDCDKWKTGCSGCHHIYMYPASFRDNSAKNYEAKRKLFCSIDDMVLVTPSKWLADLASQSYMGKYDIEIIHNGVDTETFRPTKNGWRERNGLQGKRIVLGVAGTWTPTKGLSDMIDLSKVLGDPYVIVVVGVSEKQIKKLPKSVIGIQRTYNSIELAEIYTEAEFFVNPTYDDNFPNVNLEALACGTPVLTYGTGGSPEAIDSSCGKVIEKGNIQQLVDTIKSSIFSEEACLNRARLFRKEEMYKEYIELYERVIDKDTL